MTHLLSWLWCVKWGTTTMKTISSMIFNNCTRARVSSDRAGTHKEDTSPIFVSNHELLLCNIVAIYSTSCPLFILVLVFTLLVLLQVVLKSLANQLHSAVNTAHSVAMLSLSTWAPDLPWAPLGRSKLLFCVRSWKRKSIPLWKEIRPHRERKTN